MAERDSAGSSGLWRLIAFEIDSAFSETDVDGLLQRKFTFDTDYDPDKALPTPADRKLAGTTVRLVGFKEPYRAICPQSAEQIAQRLIEHFLLMFLQSNAPKVELHDLGQRLLLNQLFETDFRASAAAHKFELSGAPFTIHGFRLITPRASRHRLVYAGNSRGVQSDNLGDYIPNLSGRLEDGNGNSFVYLAVVQSPYLDQRVNNVRTAFDIPHAEADDDQLPLLPDEIRLSDIRDASVQYFNDELATIIGSINEAKEVRIFKYVQEEAPQYKILMRYRNEFINKIPPDATKADIEAALHRELHEREVKLTQEGSRIIKEADKIKDYDAYRERFSEFMDKYNELGVSALAQYVAHRKIILEFLDRAISRGPDATKYPLESVGHNLIFPMRSTSNDLLYSQQNLWLIDERLTYHSFIASDKRLDALPDEIHTDSAKRADLLIFDRKIVFADGEQPINSIVTVEFKRPQRDDYTTNDNPLTQSFDLLADIRSGNFRDHRGRPISVATNTIPGICYVICDLTPTLKKALKYLQAEMMPDGQGYYGYHRDYRAYYEVIDYNKLLRDSQKRNRIFFEKLNVLGNM